jgi:hypothetical protein
MEKTDDLLMSNSAGKRYTLVHDIYYSWWYFDSRYLFSKSARIQMTFETTITLHRSSKLLDV